MKRYMVFLGVVLTLVSIIPAYASSRVFSEVKDNVAYIHHDDAYFNCCPHMVFEYRPDTAGIIDIFEQDTLPSCWCMCYYNFTHRLKGLEPGVYLVRVWESTWSGEEYSLAGTTTFTILAEVGSSSFTTNMSDCHMEPEGVDESDNSEGLSLENVSRSPAQKSVGIRYHLPARARVNLEIYDVTGTKIRTLNAGVRESGDHVAVWDICSDSGKPMPQGIYFVRLQAGEDARSLRLIVLR